MSNIEKLYILVLKDNYEIHGVYRYMAFDRCVKVCVYLFIGETMGKSLVINE